jgi:hypothetical protein
MTSNRPRRHNRSTRRADIEEPDQGLDSCSDLAHAVDVRRETLDDDRTLVAVWPRTPMQTRATSPRHRQQPGSTSGLGGWR